MNLILKIFSMGFVLTSFFVYSDYDDPIEVNYEHKKIDLKKEAEYLMEVLSKGKVRAYHVRRFSIGDGAMKKILKFVNVNGDNLLHFLVRLEQFKSIGNYDLDRLLVGEMEYLRGLSAWRFVRLLTKQNRQGISPVQEAAVSQKMSESTDNWRSRLSRHLSETTVSKLLKTGIPIPSQNRGLAYKALETAVGDYNWPWRTAFDAIVFVISPVALGGAIAAYGDSALIGVGTGAIALSTCYMVFKRVSDLRTARQFLPSC